MNNLQEFLWALRKSDLSYEVEKIKLLDAVIGTRVRVWHESDKPGFEKKTATDWYFYAEGKIKTCTLFTAEVG